MINREFEILSPQELKIKYPISQYNLKLRNKRIEEIQNILFSNSKKFILIVGPCSAHDKNAVLKYCEELGKIYENVKEKILIIPRIYTSKPRTRGIGYKGMFFDPNLDCKENIQDGIISVRTLNLDIINASGLFGADELLFPENYDYFDDLLAYYVIGARSSENPFHRFVASGIDFPVGIKNPTNGNLEQLANSIYSAKHTQTFKLSNYQVSSSGNAYSHAILRGYTNNEGVDIPNYNLESVLAFDDICQNVCLSDIPIIIDCNHANSNKKYEKQMNIAKEIMQIKSQNSRYDKLVKGIMLESFLVSGNQKENEVFGKSITDPCLGIEETQKLIYELAEML